LVGTRDIRPRFIGADMRVIFVDYDGVFHPVSDLHWFSMGLPVDACIERGRLFRWTSILREMLHPHPDVRIVVHSSWRLLHPEEKVKSLLGPLAERVIHVISGEYDRDNGIAAYIAENKVEDYVILDDRPDWFAPDTSGLIVCDSETGIYDERVQIQLIDWLKNVQQLSLSKK
jgi:hypothetical protein